MRIIFDARWLGRTGIGRYAEELLHELQQTDHDNEYLVLLLPEYYATWKPGAGNFSAVETTYDVYTWQEQLLLGRQLAALKADLVHFTSFNLPVGYRGKYVATVHDLTLVHFKNPRGGGLKRLVYELKYRVMLGILKVVTARAATLFVPTQYVADDVAKHYPKAAGKIVVTPEAANPAFAKAEPVASFVVPERFVMYVGNYYPYKNIGRLVEAFAKTRAHRAGVKLLLCGKDSYFQGQVRRQAGADGGVVFTGFVSDSELATLYQKAALYLFPSLCEGFGLPGLEAMTYGTPVLAARASCLPEVLGQAADYFDPLDTDDMARNIDELLENPARLAELRAAGPEHVKGFSWRRMAEQTHTYYR